MYLKSIKANGFKSFADKIELDIKKGITAIVGPNGSGKSNIVDAVKWVLGEQSVKSLRGNNAMSDVIFSGSETRSPLNRAMVSLTFDNSDRYLNADFNEIEIKRVVYRTGENEYYINNAKVRLKDITELFMDSGAGKESFNIISQGAVMDIVNSKPEDRRPIFEEAAGVIKYKKRKEESLKKLEKTKDNLDKVSLLLNELAETLGPLKEQNDKALRYLDTKKELESIEIALIVKDAAETHKEYNYLKEELKKIKIEVDNLEVNNASQISKIEKLKLTIIKIDDDISKLNNDLLNISSKINDAELQKQLIMERNKFAANKELINTNLLELKEKQLQITNQITGLNNDLVDYNDKVNKNNQEINDVNIEFNNLSDKINQTSNNINSKDQEIKQLENNISILKDNIDNNNRVPYSVKNIINNPRLSGVHNILGNLIETDNKYINAIDIALGGAANFIVVEDSNSAKECISYLKDNRLGRATFFPLDIIKGKGIETDILETLQNINGYIGIASDLVKFNKIYSNIITNQLGNIIVVDNIDTLNKVGKLLNYKYRIVTIDGEIQFTGGALSGGSIKSGNSILKDKEKLEEYSELLNKNKNEYLEIVNEYNKYLVELNKIKGIKEELFTKDISFKEHINQIKIQMNTLNDNLKLINVDIQNNESELDNKLDDSLNKLIDDIYKYKETKDNIVKNISKLKDEKNDVSLEISEIENVNKQKNSLYNSKNQELKDKEIRVTKLGMKLDNLLDSLNQNYNITFEKARDDYKLELDFDVARDKVSELKKIINKLGVVNLGAPDEYNRINTRYEFLDKQKVELDTSVNELLNIITEMDEIMVTRFKETFQKIQEEFSNVFRKLFKGGKGLLKLTNPDDILNTGIDIIAEPPGKKLNSIVLLSGGEKTLTAIALLFSILNIKTVPFCILDEVEAALDEANVDAFGKYLEERKDKSQFIIITHKNRTMEYADVLYGITMQESGVSKLVSVKLEDQSK